MCKELIKRLRGAHGGPDGIKMCQEAADAMEDQQREIEALELDKKTDVRIRKGGLTNEKTDKKIC